MYESVDGTARSMRDAKTKPGRTRNGGRSSKAKRINGEKGGRGRKQRRSKR